MGLIKTARLTPLFLLFATGCSSMLYHPSQDYYASEAKVSEVLGVTPQPVTFLSGSTSDSPRLTGWYFKQTNKRSKTRGVLVHFHGNGENLSTHFLSFYWVLEHGFDYFIFDYQGYGHSPGKPSPQNTVQDGMAALRWIQESHPKLPIVVAAQSLGGAVALSTLIKLKNEIPVRLLILEGTFLSYKKAAKRVMSHSWITWLFQPLGSLVMSDEYAPKDHLQNFPPIPSVVIHGDADQVIDYDLGQEVFEALPQPKEFWSIPEGRHTDTFFRHQGIYRKKLIERLTQAGL